MRVGIFIPETSCMLLDLVMRHLASQMDMDVVVLPPDPARAGRAPLASESCNVVVFAPSEDGPRGIHDLCACVELRDDGRAAVAWTISARRRAISAPTPDSLADAVRRAEARPI